MARQREARRILLFFPPRLHSLFLHTARPALNFNFITAKLLPQTNLSYHSRAYKAIFLNFPRMRARSRAVDKHEIFLLWFSLSVFISAFLHVASRIPWKSSHGKERERYTIKNRRSSQSPCRVPLIIHVDSKTRRQEGFELRASKKHFFFFFFARRKFLTPINHDYLTEASPLGAVYFTYKVTRWITRALFSPLGCEGITFLNGSAMGLADTSLPLAVSLPW